MRHGVHQILRLIGSFKLHAQSVKTAEMLSRNVLALYCALRAGPGGESMGLTGKDGRRDGM